MSSRRRLHVAVLACAPALGPGCDYKDQTPAVLQIVAPTHGATIREDEDIDPDTQGIQIQVVVEGEGEGHVLELERLRGGPPEQIATATLEGGRATFDDVVLFDGSNTLQARDPRTDRSSLPVTVYVQTTCRKIFFIEPELRPGATEMVLGPLDDRDGTPCGDSLAVRLIAGTGLPDGSWVTLVAGGATLANAATRGGVLELDPLVLDKTTLAALGSEPFELVLRVAGGACPDYAFEARVRVDCMGPPTCRIETLGEDGLVGPSADLDPNTPGVQLDIRVASEPEARGQPVELAINDQPVLPPATVASEGEAVAEFASVSLPEGDVRIDAVCYDAVHNSTAAARRTVLVDSLGCPVSITSPALDAMFPSSAPEVALSATVSGGDCVRWYAGLSADERCADLFTGTGEELPVGQSVVDATLTLLTPGPSYLCVGVVDIHGNTSQSAVRVVLEEP
jgi:hypothetical protein